MTSILIIGECMLELKAQDEHSLSKSFAGDTYNSAVYAKRWFADAKVSYFSAVGTDEFSQQMVQRWQQENIDTEWVLESQTAQVGIYSIHTDEAGERSFAYWRKGSAATQMMQLLGDKRQGLIDAGFDCLYFSGLSLAILSDEDKQALIDLVADIRAKGCKVAFDPNYRARMWRDKEHAIEWLEKAYAVSDILFPGLEDHEDMLGQSTKDAVVDYVSQYKVSESVVKCGKDGVYVVENGADEVHLPFTPAPVQVDATAAGDSFAGTYLASRLSGNSTEQAVKDAANVAGFVVQHRGAIVDIDVFRQAFPA
ncbi:sugar kinase [Saccharobesus litoralis]|uniref:Sugar kinase n=1 Tax=Saccharobesus litoralis TaxID=2172099 RepID=A0A2S0VTC1_9ALTE|nr:sugar kinase [Saccharobesus litoralis]AWB67466.1 sugar kinase [Saccharobesus litoralis]